MKITETISTALKQAVNKHNLPHYAFVALATKSVLMSVTMAEVTAFIAICGYLSINSYINWKKSQELEKVEAEINSMREDFNKAIVEIRKTQEFELTTIKTQMQSIRIGGGFTSRSPNGEEKASGAIPRRF